MKETTDLLRNSTNVFFTFFLNLLHFVSAVSSGPAFLAKYKQVLKHTVMRSV